MNYKIGDKIILKHMAWVSKDATIIGIRTIYDYPQYRLRFPSGTEFAWVNENEILELKKEKVQFT